MKIALYGRSLKSEDNSNFIKGLAAFFSDNHIVAYVHQAIYDEFLNNTQEFSLATEVYDDDSFKNTGADIIISIGGDGTLLDTVALIKEKNVPVLGINIGRLGFLANVAPDEVQNALADLLKNNYTIDSRSLLHLESTQTYFNGLHFALNDFVIHKNDTSSMIVVNTFINGEFLNAYWADGLIISTPTGSTGYSLSCGGPILFPHSESLSITPIAPHNLNVRPIVVSDKNIISFEVEGRSSSFLISLDSRSVSIPFTSQLAIRKSDFDLNLIQLKEHNYLKTLRRKLMWGLDKRNYKKGV
jgi:NAD+ kinase